MRGRACLHMCPVFQGHPFTDVSCDEISIIEIGHCCERDKGSERRIDRATRRTDQPKDFQGSCPATPHPQTRPR